jgi:PAS domain-containing protein
LEKPEWHGFMEYEATVDTIFEQNRIIAICTYSLDQPQVMTAINRAVAAKSVFEMEHRVLRKDGTLGWTFSRAVPMLNSMGEIMEWFGTAKDVTAAKLAQEEFLARQKLESIGTLAGGIAHDLVAG